MGTTTSSARASRTASWRPASALACALAVSCLAYAPAALADMAAQSSPSPGETAASGGTGQGGSSDVTPTKAYASATLQQCVTALTEGERSATFAGEMTAIPGTARMEMRVDVEERIPGEPLYRVVSAPGLGVWRASDTGVKQYTHIQQVTDLAAPAFYRGLVRFRWLNAKGRLIKAEEVRTPRCEQPAAPTTSATTPTTSAPTTAPSD
jgi:hypothetical protein